VRAEAGAKEVQMGACWTLNILAVNAHNKVRVAGAGGIEAVVEAMRAHAGAKEVQEAACGVLVIFGVSIAQG